MEANSSKSQVRLAKLILVPVQDSFEAMATTLEAAGFNRSGIPNRSDWRKAAKMNDMELIEACKIDWTAGVDSKVDRY